MFMKFRICVLHLLDAGRHNSVLAIKLDCNADPVFLYLQNMCVGGSSIIRECMKLFSCNDNDELFSSRPPVVLVLFNVNL